MALPGEFEYYSSRSGLPAGTLDDHKLAFFKLKTGAAGTLPGLELAYYNFKGYPGNTLDDVRRAYYAGVMGLAYNAGTVTDHQKAFFASPPPDEVLTLSVTPSTVSIAGTPSFQFDLSSTASMGSDVVQIHHSTSNNFTPDGGTYDRNMSGTGATRTTTFVTNTTWFPGGEGVKYYVAVHGSVKSNYVVVTVTA